MEVARRWMDSFEECCLFFLSFFFFEDGHVRKKLGSIMVIYNICVGVERATASCKRSESGQMCTGTDRHRMIDQEADQGVVTNRLID